MNLKSNILRDLLIFSYNEKKNLFFALYFILYFYFMIYDLLIMKMKEMSIYVLK